jgi:molybdate transport system substrate-binding protein
MLKRLIGVTLMLLAAGCCVHRKPTTQAAAKPELLCYAGINMKASVEEIAQIYESRTGIHVKVEVNDPRPLVDKIEVSGSADNFVCHDPFLPILMDNGVKINTAYTAASLTPMIAVRAGNPKNITKFEDLAQPGIRVGLTDRTSMTGNIARLMARKAGVSEAFEKNVVAEFPAGRELAKSLIDDRIDAGIIWNIVVHIFDDKLDMVDVAPELRPSPGAESEMFAPALGSIELDYVRVTVMSLATTRYPKEADNFAKLIASPEGYAVFAKNGFSPPRADRPTIAPNRKPATEKVAPRLKS